MFYYKTLHFHVRYTYACYIFFREIVTYLIVLYMYNFDYVLNNVLVTYVTCNEYTRYLLTLDMM